MIDLSDIMKPVDIRIDASNGGYVVITCRESLYDEVKEELKNTADFYGIPITFVAEEVAKTLKKEREKTEIQLVAWRVNIEPKVVANRIAEYYRQKGMNVAFEKSTKKSKRVSQIPYLPCPFCGSLDLKIYEAIVDGPHILVYCDCGAQGAAAEQEDRAIALWNTRINQHISLEEKP